MRKQLQVVALLGTVLGLGAGPIVAAETLQEISWTELERAGRLPESDRIQLEADGSLTVRSNSGEGLTLTLVEVASPGISTDRYIVTGSVRYEDVSGDGYLEMWNVFGNEGQYFTRTLEEMGPLQKISGSSDWREFGLPFDASGATAPPERLVINLVLPGGGTVSVSSMTLVQLEPGEWPGVGSIGAEALIGVWGGIAGALLGVWGAAIGWFGSKGQAKGFVLASLTAMRIVGAGVLVFGAVGYVQGVPYFVYYPLLLFGAIGFLLSVTLLPTARRRYAELELRRMKALDAS